MKTLFYDYNTSLDEVKEFLKPHLMFPSYDLRDKNLPIEEQRIDMWHINSKFGLLTLHSNTYIVKTDDDVFIMSIDSYEELLLAEIENI